MWPPENVTSRKRWKAFSKKLITFSSDTCGRGGQNGKKDFAFSNVDESWGPFLEGPEEFSDLESHSKNLKP